MAAETQSGHTRREFIDRVGRLSVAAVIPAGLSFAGESDMALHMAREGEFDLSWVTQLTGTADRALVDTTSPGRFSLQIATRYLDNCDAAYGKGKHAARVVLNLRTRAIPLAFRDDLWDRFALGVEYDVKDPVTSAPATRNPFLTIPAGTVPAEGAIADLLARRTIILVCDFAIGHLANRIATKAGSDPSATHRVLREGVVPGVFAVPSGIFGAVKAQNAGCGFVSAS